MNYPKRSSFITNGFGGRVANLQGIWNDSLNPEWGSKMTVNINTEMNYWPAEVGNLSECTAPLFEMIADRAPRGRILDKPGGLRRLEFLRSRPFEILRINDIES